MKRILLSLAALPFLAVSNAFGAITQVFTFNGLNLSVPDGNPSGRANTQTISSSIATIQSVKASLLINGTFNGDLYAYITHSGGLTTLLNRPGKTVANAFGYPDDGLDVGFDDAAASDIHTYRNITTPAPATPLTGTWQPDARNVDPLFVLDVSPRAGFFNVFNGMSASGDWTLFVADLSSGDPHTLGGWSLTITGEPIPEPSTLLMAVTMGLAVFRRRRR